MTVQFNFIPRVKIIGTTGNDSDITLTVPSNKEWNIQSIRLDNVTASSTGAGSTVSRQVEVQIQSSDNSVLYSALAGAAQPKASTWHYNFANDEVNDSAIDASNTISKNLPTFLLAKNFVVRAFDNLAVHSTADDLTMRIFVQERTRIST